MNAIHARQAIKLRTQGVSPSMAEASRTVIKKGFRKAMAKKEPILVVTIKENVVKEATLFTNVKRAEEAFTIAAMDLGARKEYMDALLNDGYYTAGDRSVCITWPEKL